MPPRSRDAAPLAALLLAVAPLGAQSAAPATSPALRYERVVLLETTAETSANVSLGDLNGDGHLDAVLAKGRHWPLVSRVLLGDGRGGFAPAFDLGPAAAKSYSGRLVDLDGDGDLDVVLSNDTPSPKRTFLNDGRGRFAAGAVYGDSLWPMRNATVADMNGDGHPDIIAANRNGRAPGFNHVCLNDGRGGFGAPCLPFAPEPATTITAADFNRDGRPDLLVPHRNGGQSRLYLGAAGGDLTKMASVPFGPADAQLRIAEAADLDGDGALDVVAIDERTGPALYVGRGDGTFALPVPVGAPGIKPYALTLGDLDCDGRPDFVVGNVDAPSAAYRNDGGFRFTATPFGDGKGSVYGIAIGDVDEDGRPDIAVARSEAPNTLYLATGAAGACGAPRRSRGAPSGEMTQAMTGR
ncbi:MAG: VCBS repeat-containing protein [Gemmatimonadetes bacterium]|nr:VCBS repeat-containing protein [Gemmatimonadota bacterium]